MLVKINIKVLLDCHTGIPEVSDLFPKLIYDKENRVMAEVVEVKEIEGE